MREDPITPQEAFRSTKENDHENFMSLVFDVNQYLRKNFRGDTVHIDLDRKGPTEANMKRLAEWFDGHWNASIMKPSTLVLSPKSKDFDRR